MVRLVVVKIVAIMVVKIVLKTAFLMVAIMD
jgi:hypothetical protein